MADTPLARAWAVHLARPDDDAARLRAAEVFSGAELVLPLAREAPRGSDDVEPETLEVDGTTFVVAHDSPHALAGGPPRPTATLGGLALARMLAGQGIGVALRLGGGAPALVAPALLDWLAGTLGAGPERGEARPLALRPPAGLAPALLAALDRRLAQGEGLARVAWLAAVDWADGSRGYLLAVVGARPGSEEPLAAGIHAAVALAGGEAVRLDVAFVAEDDPVVARLGRVGLGFQMEAPAPEGPPRLRQ